LRRALVLGSLLIASIAAGSASSATTLNLPNTTMPLGAVYTITGQTGSAAGSGGRRATGRVILTGRLNDGPWQFVRKTMTRSDGTFRLTVKPTRRGRFELRLVTPDGRVEHVVLTVT
jgi:hypothetical protein